MITPDMLAECGTEDGHQAALFCWIQQYDDRRLDLLYAIPNGGARGNDRRSAAIRGAKMKATGVKAGMPDLCLPIPMQRILETGRAVPCIVGYAGLFIELKRPHSSGKAAGMLSDKQVELHRRLRDNGNAVCVAYGWKAAAHALTDYLAGEPFGWVYFHPVDWALPNKPAKPAADEPFVSRHNDWRT